MEKREKNIFILKHLIGNRLIKKLNYFTFLMTIFFAFKLVIDNSRENNWFPDNQLESEIVMFLIECDSVEKKFFF